MKKHKPKEKWMKLKDIRNKQKYNTIQKEREYKDTTTEQIWKWIKEHPND